MHCKTQIRRLFTAFACRCASTGDVQPQPFKSTFRTASEVCIWEQMAFRRRIPGPTPPWRP